MKTLTAVVVLALAWAPASFAQIRPADIPGFRHDCEANKWSACMMMGDLYGQDSHSDESGVPVDNAQAAGFYRKACNGGFMDGCVALGLMMDQGEGMPADKAQAAVLYKKACDAGNHMGCTMLMP